jgi:RsiW-degrading membrane proteinase PrsW (M82 family)
MDINALMDWMRTVHFKKVFYLVTIVLAAILLVLKYKLYPYANRKENLFNRIIRRLLDTLIFLTFTAMAIASIVFWINGNDTYR